MEKKWQDFTIGTQASSITITESAWKVFDGASSNGTMLAIPIGTGESERIGRKIVVTDFMWRGTIQLNAELASASGIESAAWDHVRIIVYLDKQTNGAEVTPTQMWQSATIDSYRNIENASRFQILWDKKISLRGQFGLTHNGTVDEQASTTNAKKFNYHWKGRLPIEYAATLGAIAEIRTFNIGAMAITQNNNAATLVTTYGTARVRFYG